MTRSDAEGVFQDVKANDDQRCSDRSKHFECDSLVEAGDSISINDLEETIDRAMIVFCSMRELRLEEHVSK